MGGPLTGPPIHIVQSDSDVAIPIRSLAASASAVPHGAMQQPQVVPVRGKSGLKQLLPLQWCHGRLNANYHLTQSAAKRVEGRFAPFFVSGPRKIGPGKFQRKPGKITEGVIRHAGDHAT
jgi:hypothetical protein